MKNLLFLYIFLASCTAGFGQVADSAFLPVHSFTVSQKDNKSLLRWRSDSLSTTESFYAVEKSNNGKDFGLVGVTKNNSGGWTEFLDEAPSKGKTFYRIKLSNGSQNWYSEIISSLPSADLSCKFYPNPVDKVLIVRTEQCLDLQITDGSGKPLIAEKLQAGLKVVDVSGLEPGIYVITLFQKETNKLLTEKLVKK